MGKIMLINKRLTKLMRLDQSLSKKKDIRLITSLHSFYVKRSEELKYEKRKLIRPIIKNIVL